MYVIRMLCMGNGRRLNKERAQNGAICRAFMLSEISSTMEATEAVDATINFPSEVIMFGEAFRSWIQDHVSNLNSTSGRFNSKFTQPDKQIYGKMVRIKLCQFLRIRNREL